MSAPMDRTSALRPSGVLNVMSSPEDAEEEAATTPFPEKSSSLITAPGEAAACSCVGIDETGAACAEAWVVVCAGGTGSA